MNYDYTRGRVPLFPDPDVHSSMVLLRRSSGTDLADDRFLVVCPACPDAPLYQCGDFTAACVYAFTHRLENLGGQDLDQLLGA